MKPLCDRFYTAKLRAVEAGELSKRSLAEYDATCARLVKTFGRNRRVSDLDADDFDSLRADLAKQYGPVRLGNEIGRVKTIFKFALKKGWIDRAVRDGDFNKPSKTVLRKHRAKQGRKLFTAEEIRKLLDGAAVVDEDGDPKTIPPAPTTLRAMILLGINCGFGNTDCGSLPINAVDLDAGWIDFPRPKNGIDRRCPLWPETVAALREAIAKRPEPRDPEHDGLFFITKYGKPWAIEGRGDAVTLETGKRLRKLKINGRTGLGFYSLRHTFRTVADAARDQPATRLIMGHADGSIDDVYREGIEDDRLRAVADHVRSWLFPATVEEGGAR